MTVGNNVLNFIYDASGIPVAVTLNGVMYYYSVNAQGDVTGIFTATGTDLCRYVYDAWGRIVYQSGDSYIITTLNPLRYRGYVYDTETKLYHLQSRYYNPEWGRFLNADTLLATGHGSLGCNLFAYCFNNPVNCDDPSGNLAVTASILIAAIIGGAIAGATVNVFSYLSTNEDPTVGGVIGAIAVGAVTGGLGGAAGMVGGGWAVALSVTAGLVSGTYTAITTDGPLAQKLLAGFTSAVFAGGGTYLGSLIPLDGLSYGLTVAGNAMFGMTIGGYLEIANTTIQGWIEKGFENHASQETQQPTSTCVTMPNAWKTSDSSAPNVVLIFA